CERLELNDTERVGFAREDEDVRRRHVSGQSLAFLEAKEPDIREALPQLGFLGALSDHDLRARKIEREKRFEILLNRDATDTEEDRARQIKFERVVRLEDIGVDAARPHAEIPKTELRELLHHRRG